MALNAKLFASISGAGATVNRRKAAAARRADENSGDRIPSR